MVFSIVTNVCNQQHNPFWNIFITSQRNLVPLAITPAPFSPNKILKFVHITWMVEWLWLRCMQVGFPRLCANFLPTTTPIPAISRPSQSLTAHRRQSENRWWCGSSFSFSTGLFFQQHNNHRGNFSLGHRWSKRFLSFLAFVILRSLT